MWTKKIEIKDENHLKEVVKALESMGEEVSHILINDNSYLIKSLWYGGKWCYSSYSIYSDYWVDSKDVREYEIITKTSYELKELPKIKITCKSCGKTFEYKDSNDMFEDFVIFRGSIDNGNQVITFLENKTVCKDCIISVVDKWN